MNTKMMHELKRFNYIATEIDAAYHKAAQKLGITDSAMMILYFVCDNGGSRMLSDICRLSGVSKQTINSALRKLETEGIVTLNASGGKKKTVTLTEAGKEYAKEKVLPIMKIENEIFSEWTKQQREMYLSLTQSFLDSFKEKISKL